MTDFFTLAAATRNIEEGHNSSTSPFASPYYPISRTVHPCDRDTDSDRDSDEESEFDNRLCDEDDVTLLDPSSDEDTTHTFEEIYDDMIKDDEYPDSPITIIISDCDCEDEEDRHAILELSELTLEQSYPYQSEDDFNPYRSTPGSVYNATPSCHRGCLHVPRKDSKGKLGSKSFFCFVCSKATFGRAAQLKRQQYESVRLVNPWAEQSSSSSSTVTNASEAVDSPSSTAASGALLPAWCFSNTKRARKGDKCAHNDSAISDDNDDELADESAEFEVSYETDSMAEDNEEQIISPSSSTYIVSYIEREMLGLTNDDEDEDNNNDQHDEYIWIQRLPPASKRQTQATCSVIVSAFDDDDDE